MERRHSLGAAEAVPFGIRFEPPRDNSRIVGCSSPIRSTYGVPVIRQVGRKFRDNLVSLPMCVVAPEMSAAQVLSAFHRDAPYLFLGAAFVAVGMVSAAFSALRRKQDPLLLYFALYAVLYGIRLWIQAELLEISIHESWFYPRLRSGINYIVPIPAILFFNAAGLLRGAGKIAGNILIIASSVLATATLLLGPASIYDRFNSVVVIAAMLAFVPPLSCGATSEAASGSPFPAWSHSALPYFWVPWDTWLPAAPCNATSSSARFRRNWRWPAASNYRFYPRSSRIRPTSEYPHPTLL